MQSTQHGEVNGHLVVILYLGIFLSPIKRLIGHKHFETRFLNLTVSNKPFTYEPFQDGCRLPLWRCGPYPLRILLVVYPTINTCQGLRHGKTGINQYVNPSIGPRNVASASSQDTTGHQLVDFFVQGWSHFCSIDDD